MATKTVTSTADRSDGVRELLARVAAELDARSSTVHVVIELLDDLVNENPTADPNDPRGHTQQALALIEGVRCQIQRLQCLCKEIDQFREQELTHG